MQFCDAVSDIFEWNFASRAHRSQIELLTDLLLERDEGDQHGLIFERCMSPRVNQLSRVSTFAREGVKKAEAKAYLFGR